MAEDKYLGAQLPADIVQEWNEFCETNGYVKARALQAAMLLFMAAPLSLRGAIFRDGRAPAADWFGGSLKPGTTAMLLKQLNRDLKEIGVGGPVPQE